jgi:glycosyltransferase involved in cell wall biosynthesis
LAPHGGEEALAAWTIEALKGSYDLTVLTWDRPDLERINARYGTALKEADANWLFPGSVAHLLVDLIPDHTWNWQRRSWLMRIAKRIHHQYALLMATDGEIDFGRPGIQYVNYPWRGEIFLEIQAYGSLTGWRMIPVLLRSACRPWMKIADFHFDQMRRNLTLANSQWGAAEYRRYYQRDAHAVYPPAAGLFPSTEWGQRRDEFIAIARLESDKNHHRIVRILQAVRSDYPQIKLHIVGTRLRNDKGERDYRKLRTLIDPEADWVKLYEDLPRSGMMRLLGELRYGIHVFENEHFGMGVAEMTRAGLIPFVHDSGGQVEIVQHPALRFCTDEEAVKRIKAILGDPPLQQQARAALQESGRRFTPERFCAEILHWAELWRRHAVIEA